MKRLSQRLALVGLLAALFACIALAAEPGADGTSIVPPIMSNDFRIEVETNGHIYHNRDVLRLAVKLLNNSPQTVFVGICPVEAAADEPAEADQIEQGFLDGIDVDVAIVPPTPPVIGYATLTRLGPSPVPEPTLAADEKPPVQLEPKKFRLPLFGSPSVPGHSTRIISVANILIAGPLLEPALKPEPKPTAAAADEADTPIDIIPAVGKHVPLKPGYYLLECNLEKICGTGLAQAQKIIHIKPRILKPLPKPIPVPEPKPKPEPKPTPKPSLKNAR